MDPIRSAGAVRLRYRLIVNGTVRHSGTYTDPRAIAREAISRAAGLGAPLPVSERGLAGLLAASGDGRVELQAEFPSVVVELATEGTAPGA